MYFNFHKDTPEDIHFVARRLFSNLTMAAKDVKPVRAEFIIRDLEIFYSPKTIDQCKQDHFLEELRLVIIPQLVASQDHEKIISALARLKDGVNIKAGSTLSAPVPTTQNLTLG